MAAQTGSLWHVIPVSALFMLCIGRKAIHGHRPQYGLPERIILPEKRLFHLSEPATRGRWFIHQPDSHPIQHTRRNGYQCNYADTTGIQLQRMERRKDKLYGNRTLLSRCTALFVRIRDFLPSAVLRCLHRGSCIRHPQQPLAGCRNCITDLAVPLYRTGNHH